VAETENIADDAKVSVETLALHMQPSCVFKMIAALVGELQRSATRDGGSRPKLIIQDHLNAQ
jgi:hypothetical protein